MIISLRGRALSQREHPRQVLMVEEPSSTCLQLPQEEGSLPSGAVHHPVGKPAPSTHWVGFAHQGQTPQCQETLVPQQSRETASASAHGEQPALPGATQSMACQYPVSPGSSSLQEESSCRLHCKIMRGQLLGYSWDKQLLLQLPQAFAAEPVPGAAPFAVLNSSASQAMQGRNRLQGRRLCGGCQWISPYLSSTWCLNNWLK